jgi:hypothetical protein
LRFNRGRYPASAAGFRGGKASLGIQILPSSGSFASSPFEGRALPQEERSANKASTMKKKSLMVRFACIRFPGTRPPLFIVFSSPPPSFKSLQLTLQLTPCKLQVSLVFLQAFSVRLPRPLPPRSATLRPLGSLESSGFIFFHFFPLLLEKENFEERKAFITPHFGLYTLFEAEL